MISVSSRFNGKWKTVTSDVLVCKSCGRFYDGMPDGFVSAEHKKCACGSKGMLNADLKELIEMLNAKRDPCAQPTVVTYREACGWTRIVRYWRANLLRKGIL